MPLESHLRRRGLAALAIGLSGLALTAPAGLAQSMDRRLQAPTSSLAGTTSSSPTAHAKTPADVMPAATEEAYGNPAPASSAAPLGVKPHDGIALLPFVLGVGALVIAIGAGTSLHALASRRRARPA